MLGISAITSTKLFSLPSFLLALFFTGAGSAALVRLFFVSLFHGRCTSSSSSKSLVTSIIVFLLVDVDGSGSVNDDSLLCVDFRTPGILTTGLEPNTSSKMWNFLVPLPVFELFVFASLYVCFRFRILSLYCLSVFSGPALFTAASILSQASTLLLLSVSSTPSFHSCTYTSVWSSNHFALFLASFAKFLFCSSSERALRWTDFTCCNWRRCSWIWYGGCCCTERKVWHKSFNKMEM